MLVGSVDDTALQTQEMEDQGDAETQTHTRG
jgi:hypothetical protein